MRRINVIVIFLPMSIISVLLQCIIDSARTPSVRPSVRRPSVRLSCPFPPGHLNFSGVSANSLFVAAEFILMMAGVILILLPLSKVLDAQPTPEHGPRRSCSTPLR